MYEAKKQSVRQVIAFGARVATFLVLFQGCSGNDAKNPPSSPVAVLARAITAVDVAELNRGVGLMGQFDYEAARDVFAKLVASHPKWPSAQLDLAIATLNRQQPGDIDAAMRLCTDVLNEDKNNIRAEYCMGILEFHEGHADAALKHFRRVAKDDPNDAFCAYFIGQCLLQLDQVAPALDEFRRAQRLDRYLQSAYYGEFQALQQLGRSAEIEPVLAEFTRLTNNPRSHLANIATGRLGTKRASRLPSTCRNAPPGGKLLGRKVQSSPTPFPCRSKIRTATRGTTPPPIRTAGRVLLSATSTATDNRRSVHCSRAGRPSWAKCATPCF